MAGVFSVSALREHPFIQRALLRAVEVQKALGDKAPTKVEAKFSRVPDEHEFFLIVVGHSVAELLSWCEHLEHIPFYVSNYHETPSMRRAGINRHKHIVYHIESYVIMTQSLFDRVLKLVNAVFHLLNAPKNCRSHVILKNLKVKRTKVPAVVKRLDKLLARYELPRHEVVHHHSYREDRLRMLDMLYILDEINQSEAKTGAKAGNVSEHKKELTSEIVRMKKKEILKFNAELAGALIEVFTALEPHYAKEESLLRVRVNQDAT